MLFKKGYQDTDSVVSAAITKVKGIGFTNSSGDIYRIFDTADYIVPPLEQNAIFITTAAVLTQKQSFSVCPEDHTVFGAKCENDSGCVADQPIMLGNGIMTGRCVDSDIVNVTAKSCEIRAWCPVEQDNGITSDELIANVPNFTILIKNSVEFPKFGIKRSNVLETYNSTMLRNCNYDKNKDPYCPVFRVSTILNEAKTSFDKIAYKGGVISFNIRWDCDLDNSVEYCLPVYSFSRLDDVNSPIAEGWNFRYGNYYDINGTRSRDLIKAYGIRILVSVTGTAGKFNMIPFTMNLGSGLALLGVATLLCDLVVLYVLAKRNKYRLAKYQTLVEEDAFKGIDINNSQQL